MARFGRTLIWGAKPEPQAMGLRISVVRISVGRIAAATMWLIGAVMLDVVALDPARGDDTTVDPLKIPDSQLEPVKWSELDGWANDDHGAAFAAFQASCEPFNRQRQLSDTRAVAVALKDVCKRVPRTALKGDKARAFFEENFRPVRIAKLGESSGLLTGYYEPIVDGSRMPNPQFNVPLYRRPPDLVVQSQSANQSPKSASQNQKGASQNQKKAGPAPKRASWAFPNRGTVGRLNDKKEFEPYHDRLAIEGVRSTARNWRYATSPIRSRRCRSRSRARRACGLRTARFCASTTTATMVTTTRPSAAS